MGRFKSMMKLDRNEL